MAAARKDDLAAESAEGDADDDGEAYAFDEEEEEA